MIPILYESTETSFTSNGLGRLRDCISCTVTEERNGIYECDFEYPVTGSNFDEITLGRIIGVTHDESGDVQPFDIVSYSKPIDGVVTFHCVHISYRQSFLTVKASSINSLSAAFTALGTTTPANPFTYTTDKSSSGYCGCLDGTPRSVRQVLGGIEGSILDAYGGEYEWDKFDVILHSARGKSRDFAIRYGVNMLSFNDEMDCSETYSSVIPYWTDGTTTVIGDEVASGESTVTGRGECVPLDVSDKFENQPTKAQVQTMAASLLSRNEPYLPTQTIKVEFVRLQDLGFAEFSNLLECKLCDSIKVIFPDYNMSGKFKIVKTVWDVLLDRYDSMELGALSVSLSDALGIQSSLDTSGGGGGVQEVTVTQTLTGGTEIGSISVDGTSTKLYAPKTYGTVYTATTSKTISNTNIDSPTTGASISVPAGTYVVSGMWGFSTRSSSGTTNSECQVYNQTASTPIARQRVFAAGNNWNVLSCAGIVTLTTTSTLCVRASTSRAYTTATDNTTITAVRIA